MNNLSPSVSFSSDMLEKTSFSLVLFGHDGICLRDVRQGHSFVSHRPHSPSPMSLCKESFIVPDDLVMAEMSLNQRKIEKNAWAGLFYFLKGAIFDMCRNRMMTTGFSHPDVTRSVSRGSAWRGARRFTHIFRSSRLATPRSAL